MIDKEEIEQAIMLDCLGQFEVMEFSRTLYWLSAGDGKSTHSLLSTVSAGGV